MLYKSKQSALPLIIYEELSEAFSLKYSRPMPIVPTLLIMRFGVRFYLRAALCFLVPSCIVYIQPAFGDISFSRPAGPSETIGHCEEYFSYEWGYPLDMRDQAHGFLQYIPNNEVRDIDGLSYTTAGTVRMTSTAGSPLVTMVSPLPFDSTNNINAAVPTGSRYGELHPIDTSKYRYFSIRMYSSADSYGRLIWGMHNGREALTSFPTKAGWHTYELDLTAVTIQPLAGSSLNWTADSWQSLSFLPAHFAGVTVEIDSVQLTSSERCGELPITFDASSTSAENYVVAIDTDTDPFNGVLQHTSGAASGATTAWLSPTAGDLNTKRLLPGDYKVYGFTSGDWASTILLDPWDFNANSDIISWQTSGLTNVRFEGGKLLATTTNSDPSIGIQLKDRSIDLSRFNKLSVGIKHTFPVGHTSTGIEVFYLGSAGYQQRLVTNSASGEQVYSIDLNTAHTPVTSLRLDPATSAPGTQIEIDFISLTSNGSSTLPSSTMTEAPGLLRIFNPSLEILQPDIRGGRDFAQNVLGNAWNMNDKDEIQIFNSIHYAEIHPRSTLIDTSGQARSGDLLKMLNVGGGNGDPQIGFLNRVNSSRRFDPREYVNVCFRGWNSTEPNGFNSVARIIWRDSSILDDRIAYKDGDDIIIRRDSNDYCLDMRQQMFARTDPPTAAGGANPWISIGERGSTVDTLRIDMNEDPTRDYASVLDYATLRTDHEAATRYAVVVKAPLTMSVTLFAVPVAGGGEISIGTLGAGRETNVFQWDVSSVPEGSYRVRAQIELHGNILSRTSPGRIIVRRDRAQDSQSPVMYCHRPGDGYVATDQLEIAGYALDETRLATLEVTIDGILTHSFLPTLFSRDAQQAFGHLAEANNPGFQDFVNVSNLSLGSHQARITAYDTAGNQTACQFNFTRSTTGGTSPLVYPPNNEAPFSIPAVTIPAPVPRVSVTVKNSLVTFKVTNSVGCPTVQLILGRTAALGGAVTLFTKTGAATLTGTVNNVSKPISDRRRGEDGMFYARARCSLGPLSSTIRVNLNGLKTRKKDTKATIVRYLRSRISVQNR